MNTNSNHSELEQLRSKLDAVDADLLSLLSQRFKIIEAVATLKKETSIPVMQKERVEQLLTSRKDAARRLNLDEQFVSRLFRSIVAEACKLENRVIGNDNGPLGAQATRIDHVAIAVINLEDAVDFYQNKLGFEVVERWSIEGAYSGMNAAVLEAGPISFVLVEGKSELSNVCRYIKAYGPGVQHIAIEVDDIDAAFSELKGRGFEFIGGIYDFGGLKQVFSKRDVNSGVQIEIISRGSSARFEKGNVQRLFETMERENVF